MARTSTMGEGGVRGGKVTKFIASRQSAAQSPPAASSSARRKRYTQSGEHASNISRVRGRYLGVSSYLCEHLNEREVLIAMSRRRPNSNKTKAQI